MKKRFLNLFASTLLCFGVVFSLASCEKESEVEKIREIYELYAANGGELTYNEWLDSIKGDKGDKGDS